MAQEGGVENYVRKGRGGIYWRVSDAEGENPLMLAIKAAEAYPDCFRPWLTRVRELRIEDLDGMVARVPAEWMSIEAKQFCLKLMSLTVEKLKDVQW